MKTGWDGGFDNGKLFFYPLRVAGYTKQPPATGDPLHYSVSGAAFQGHERLSIYASADAFYERWTDKAAVEDLQWREQMYQLALYLERNAAELPELPPPEALAVFAEANEDKISIAFRALLNEQPVLAKPWIDALSDLLDTQTQMMLILKNFQMERLASALEEIILEKSLSPEGISEPLPDKVVQNGGPMIQALSALWTKEAIPLNAVQRFEEREQERLFRYLISTEFAEADWVYERLLHSPEVFYRMLEDEAFEMLAFNWLAAQVPDPWRPARRMIARAILQERWLEQLAASNLDWKLALERYLERNEWTKKDLRKINKAGRKAGEIGEQYPLLRQLSRPARPLPHDLDLDTRRMLIQAQIEALGLTPKKLKSLGWTKEDVRAALNKASAGLVYKLRSLIRWL